MKKSKKDTQMPSLALQKSDHLSALGRSILGAAPYIGNALAEVLNYMVPNQREDRLVDFAVKLNQKVENLDKSFITSQLTDENFVDILEESMIQAAHSVAEKRREYIASVVANGLSDDQVEFIETRRVLKLLSELNDNEIIILRRYLVPTLAGDEEFRTKHKNVLEVERAVIGSPQSVIEKEAMHNSYIENLCNFGLLRKEFSFDITEKLEHDRSTNTPKVKNIVITPLGTFFLRQIGLI